jgi:hypothetical protein
VTAVKKLILFLILVTPLILVVGAKDPQALGHLIALIFIYGAKLLNAVAEFVIHLLKYFSH